MMERRTLGRTGLEVSGTRVRMRGGRRVDGTRQPARSRTGGGRAIELGINYFDTAAMYGNGESERNLGRVMKSLRPDIRVGTKVRTPAGERTRVAAAVMVSLEASLQRLRLDQVDLFQLHNHITGGRDSDLTLELAVRFVISHDAVSTALVGISTLEHLEHATAAANKGPLPREAIERITAAQNSFVGEPR